MVTKAKGIVWHVVTSADGVIFGVYGAKMKPAADAMANSMSRPGVTFYVDTVTRTKRPLTGTRLS